VYAGVIYRLLRRTPSIAHKLKKLAEIEESYAIGYKLAGIVCTIPDYRLAWKLNRHLELNFEMEEEIVIYEQNSPIAYFSRFEAFDPMNRLVYTLIENKSAGHVFVPELKQFDYLLMVTDAIDFFDLKTTISQAKNISELNWITEIDHIKIKSTTQLILPETKRHQQYKKLLT
jgi:hypothetical protein